MLDIFAQKCIKTDPSSIFKTFGNSCSINIWHYLAPEVPQGKVIESFLLQFLNPRGQGMKLLQNSCQQKTPLQFAFTVEYNVLQNEFAVE